MDGDVCKDAAIVLGLRGIDPDQSARSGSALRGQTLTRRRLRQRWKQRAPRQIRNPICEVPRTTNERWWLPGEARDRCCRAASARRASRGEPHLCLKHSLKKDRDPAQGEREGYSLHDRAAHVAGGVSAGRPRSHRHARGLRHDLLRRVHRSAEWRGGEVMHHVRGAGGRRGNPHGRRTGKRRRSFIPFRRRLEIATDCSAATARRD